MTYIDIPFLAHLAFGRDRGLQFFVHAGPQISFLISESETIKGIDMNTLSNTKKAVYGVAMPGVGESKLLRSMAAATKR